MRGRREHIVRGAKLMALAPKLKTRQIKKFERKCRARVNQLAALTSASAGIPARLYDLNSDGGRYRIDYAGPGQWTVEVVRAPPKKAVRKKPAAKTAKAKKAAAKKAVGRGATKAQKRPKSAPAVEAAQPRTVAANTAAGHAQRGKPGKRSAKRLTSPGPVSDPPDKALKGE